MSEIKLSRAIGLLEGTIKGMKAFGNFNKEGALESLEEVKTILENYSPDNDSWQGWISVKEKLPEIGLPITYAQNQEMYLVFSRGEISIAFYDGDNIFDSPCDGHLNEVSHWQPLPTEPK